MEKETTHIRISKETRIALELAKKKESFDSYIALMLRYFAVTNIAPESCQVTPLAPLHNDLKKIFNRVNDCIEIMRGIEKSSIKPIFELVKLNYSTESDNSNLPNNIDINEVQSLIEINTSLDEKLKKSYIENKELKQQIEQNKSSNTEQNIDKSVIREAVNSIFEKSQSSTFNKDAVTINKAFLQSYLDRILNEIM